MEKRVAHYGLQSIKELISKNQYFITATSRRDYVNLGLEDEEVIEIIMNLSNRDLYKSMTSNSDHKIWQDVYYKNTKNLKLYIKLQVNEKAIIISFKERT